MMREFSAGGVVVRLRQGRWWLAAIEPEKGPETGGGKAPKPVLALPKGLVDPGEKPPQTAIREVREETGVEATLVAKLKDVRYVYVRSWGDGQRVFKVVSFFLLRYRAGRLGRIAREMRIEVRRAVWLRLEDASRQLTYRGEREVAELAREYLANHPEMADRGKTGGEESHTQM